MNVLLVNPKINLPVRARLQPPLSLAYLAAAVKQCGERVKVVDLCVQEEKKLWEISFVPDLIGITAVTPQIGSAARLIQDIKLKWPEAMVVLGGPHATALPGETLTRTAADAIVCGEGEDALIDLCRCFKSRSSLECVDGIFYGEGGAVKQTKPRRCREDIDGLPFPAYEYFEMNLYTGLQPYYDYHAEREKAYCLLTSRGCPYQCAFCSQSVFPRRWRARSPENVAEEWGFYVNEGRACEIGIVDDAFNTDRKRVIDICKLLIERRLNRVPWIMINGIRANTADEEMLGWMRRAGCKRVAFGVENGNQRILDLMQKNVSLAQLREAFRNAKRVGLETIGFFIIGYPGESLETMEDTIRFALELNPDVADFLMATPFPGTRLYETAVRNGLLIHDDWEEYVFLEGKVNVRVPGVEEKDILAKWRSAYRRFYLRPLKAGRTLKRLGVKGAVRVLLTKGRDLLLT